MIVPESPVIWNSASLQTGEIRSSMVTSISFKATVPHLPYMEKHEDMHEIYT